MDGTDASILQRSGRYRTWIMLAVLLLLAALVLIYGCNLRNRWRFRHIPGPTPSWLGGNLKQLNVPFDSHIVINRWARQYGPLFKIFVGRTPVMIVTDADLVKQLGTKSFMKFHNRPQPIMRFHHGSQTEFEEAGMLFARDKFWAGIRATCEPLFHSRMLRAHGPLINDAASGLVQRLHHLHTAGSVQINDAMAGLTMEVIGGAAFGVDFHAQGEKKSPIVQHAQSLFQPPSSNSFAAMRYLMFAFPFVVPLMYRFFILLGAKRIQEVMEAKGYILGTSQRLLSNAREASKAASSSDSSSSSSASNSGSEDEHDSADPTRNSSNMLSLKTPAATPDADHDIVEGVVQNRSQSEVQPNVTSVLNRPNTGSDYTPACDSPQTESCQTGDSRPEQAVPLLSASPAASSTASAAASTSDAASVQTPGEEGRASRGWRPSWYSATEAANSSTGQGSPPQPWWKLDSWVTALAELQFQRGRAEGGYAYQGQVPEGHSLLYSLITARRKDDLQPLSDLHICAQAFTFVLAGYETTSTAISYALYELARNPVVQSKLQAEVDAFGRERQPSFDDLSSFPYAEAVFHEALRLHPPVTPFIALIRESSRDTELNGLRLPAGTKVGINVLGMHHDPKHFPNPEVDFFLYSCMVNAVKQL
ncbi:hypothetical protein ABBQ38_009804 [Trebouxia sp. C0009 RCD-2024]